MGTRQPRQSSGWELEASPEDRPGEGLRGLEALWGGGFGDRGDRQLRVTPLPLTSREARKAGKNKMK